jgi:hypothetical protein
MNIVSALMKENLYITYGNKRLFFEDDQWVIVEKTHRGKFDKFLIRTHYQEEAVEELLKD